MAGVNNQVPDRKIFRAFSIRGIAETELTDEICLSIGRGIGRYFNGQDPCTLVVGHDVRVSSPRIADAVTEGLLASGHSVRQLGMVPTPFLNYATDFYGAAGGVMITASHNPPQDNGLKIRSQTTLDENELREIYDLTLEGNDLAVGRGVVHSVDSVPLESYLSALKQQLLNPRGARCKIVVDGNNGTNGPLACRLLRELGFEVVELHCEPDGTFPNGSPDPTAEGATRALGNAVKESRADIGFAYDGDGDRVVAVDERGETIPGDQLLALLAVDALARQSAHKNVVYEVLCSQAVADAVEAAGGHPLIAPSGYFYIQQAMIDHQAVVGGELSGHYFFRDPLFRFDDAFLATIRTLNVLLGSAQPISVLVDDLPAYASAPEERLACPERDKAAIVQSVLEAYQGRFFTETVDGVRIHFPDGWALVRQSNTQPVISMRCEARSVAALEEIQTEVRGLVLALLAQATGETED